MVGMPVKSPADRDRRSIYVLAKRNMRLPLLEAFDQPDMLNSCPRRTNTTTAPQALEMLNGESTAEAARQWGGKLLSECGDDEAKLVRAGVHRRLRPGAAGGGNQNRGALPQSTGRRVKHRIDTAGRLPASDSHTQKNQSGVSRGRGRFLPRGALLERVPLRRLTRQWKWTVAIVRRSPGVAHFESAQSRRDFLLRAGGGFGALALWSLMSQQSVAAETASSTAINPLAAKTPPVEAKAKSVIWCFIDGGPSHIDLFDPKPSSANWPANRCPLASRAR